MTDVGKRDRGLLRIDTDECKGCGLCVEACPPNVIVMSEHLNHYGYRPAMYSGAGCTGCGICFMACPEPGAITVLRAVVAKASSATPSDSAIVSGSASGVASGIEGANHA